MTVLPKGEHQRLKNMHPALVIMFEADLIPQVEYPGANTPWECIHVICERTVYPMYGSVQQGQGGCKWCAKNADVNPDEAEEYMRVKGFEPLAPFPGANIPWLSRHIICGRQASPRWTHVRNRDGSNCGWCAGNLVDPDEAIDHMRKYDLEPQTPYPGSQALWECIHTVCGNRISARYSVVQSKKSAGCGICSGTYVDPDKAADLMRSNDLDPQVPYPGADNHWQCIHQVCGRVVYPTYSSIIDQHSGCKYCAKKGVDPDEAVEIMHNAGLLPQEEYPGAARPWKCIHTICGRVTSPTYSAVRQQLQGVCKWCAGRANDPTEAEELMRSKGFEPLVPYPGSGARWECRHTACGKIVTPSYKYVASRGGGCGWCSGKLVEPAEAAELMRSKGFDPLVPYPGAKLPWSCKHTACGKEVTPTYSSILAGQRGCVYCGGKVVDPDEAVQLMRSKGFEPLEPYPGAAKPWRCTHGACRETVTPTYSNTRAEISKGCKHCAKKCPPTCPCSVRNPA